jgi:endonuclease YncB( thermonuclease family)
MIRHALFAVAVILPALATPLLAQSLTGQATVIDGDTIEIHQQRIRLSGIDAPESDQLCRGNDSLPYRCGAKAANELDRFIAGRPVSCVDIDERTYKRVVAVCTVGGVDLADWMARQGLAFDWPKYSKGDYAAAQNEARQAERGVWSGSYVKPWDYRACTRGGGRPSNCSDEVSTR